MKPASCTESSTRACATFSTPTASRRRRGAVIDKALEEILFRAAHGVLQSLAPYPRAQRVALLPSVVRLLLAAFIDEIAATDQANLSRPPGGTAP